MSSLQHQSGVQANGLDQVVVTLIATETTSLANVEEAPAFNELPLEAAMNRRANAMTHILIEIMDRPVPQRFFGLNE